MHNLKATRFGTFPHLPLSVSIPFLPRKIVDGNASSPSYPFIFKIFTSLIKVNLCLKFANGSKESHKWAIIL